MALVDNLVAWYGFNSSLADSTGTFPLTISGTSPTFTSGKIGNAVQIARNSNTRLDTVNGPLIDNTYDGSYSYSLWVKIVSDAPSGGSTIIAQQYSDFYSASYNFFEIVAGTNSSNRYVRFTPNWAIDFYSTQDTGVVLSLDTWYHIGFTYSIDEDHANAFFCNGELIRAYPTINVANPDPDGFFRIGNGPADGYYNDGVGNDTFCLDLFGFWKRALSITEIRQLYALGFGYDVGADVLHATYFDVGHGGAKTNGTAIYNKRFSYSAGGVGPLLGGTALTSHINTNINASGGVWANGQALRVDFIPMNGGIIDGGTSIPSVQFVMLGGVTGGGTSIPFGITNEPPFGTTARGVIASGAALSNTSHIFSTDVGGEAIVSGSSESAITAVAFNGRGGILLESDPIVDFTFVKTFKFLYNVQAMIEKECTFFFNVGQLREFWYRVISKPIDGNDPCPIQGSNCCQQYVVNIHARTVAELCEKLSKRKFKFPIETVHRFSRPAENSAVAEDEAAGIDHTCQQLIPVSICSVPACADFCVDFDLKTKFGYSDFAQVDAFFSAISNGSAFMGGVAGIVFDPILPEFDYTMAGGPVLGNATTYLASNISGRGGVAVGGSAHSTSSRWTYVGGVWPNIDTPRYGSINQSFEQEPNDQSWSLAQNVDAADSLFAQTDISYGKKSQLLVTTGFGLELPNWGSVLGVRVRVSRVATQIGIRDVDVYLMRDGEIISDNLANVSVDWPFIETTRTYGSNGLDGLTPWRNPENDHYVGPLTINDLNDPSFGVAIRVYERLSMPTAIAKINYINVEVFYEKVDGSIVRISGEAKAKSPSYHYQSTGKTVVDSLTSPKLGYRFFSKGLDSSSNAAVQIGGGCSYNFYNVGSGGAKLGGEAKINPIFEITSGGIGLGGAAKVTPYFETMSGGIVANGKAGRSDNIHFVMSGGPVLASKAFVPQVAYLVTMDGTVVLQSNMRLRSSIFKWASDGNVALIAGGADLRPGNIVPPFQELTFGMTILQTTVAFKDDVDSQNAQILSENVNKCGCLDIPLTIELTQNFAKNNVLSMFLLRNSYNIPNILKLRYNATNDSWQCNLHYRGSSSETNSPELWDLVFELQCTDTLGATVIGRNVWKLACQIIRKNLITREQFETRVIVAVIPDKICASTGALLDFSVDYDTQMEIAVVNPNATVYQSSIYDNIGIFRNQAWISSPDLQLRVSEASRIQSGSRVDLTDVVLT